MTRLLAALAATTALALGSPAVAQTMPGMEMPGMTMPAQRKPAAKAPAARKPAARRPAPRKPAARRKPTPRATPAAPAPAMDSSMPGMTMPSATPEPQTMPRMPGMAAPSPASTPDATAAMPGMDMPGDHKDHDMGAMSGMTMPGMEQTGTALPAGDAPAPRPPMYHYADRFFPPAEMERSRMRSMREQGGTTVYQVVLNLAEYQVREGRDGYRWDGQAFVGGDINRLWIKSEGEGAFREGVDSAEVQALYSRAIDPYFNFQAGIRQDLGPGPNRTYATVGFEGLAPYMFEVGGSAYLSNKGEVFGRLEGYYDQRITQRLVLQPRVEFNLSAQDVPQIRLGSGLTDAELGLRLRYEITRRFAPYVGVSYEAKTGRTADYARADGKDPTTTSFVVGVRLQF
ncbi:copper resistance protein B [Sphingomonas canadensis]|uniref:Copper resistance protein B n=1 Tax=Sphingomonas canadensis TaxID=1219257 RepID=A0ABW3H847_9SPHN|nr:copper resistance protein B [Sphingomonas canadensis]MCW3837283.1 copper resistance protein B [Sphingomonas canadensis]